MGIWCIDPLINGSSPYPHHITISAHRVTKVNSGCLAPICCRCRRLKVACATARGRAGRPQRRAWQRSAREWRDGFSLENPRLRHVKSPGTSEKWWRIGVFLPQNRFQVAKRFHVFGRNMDVHLWQSSFSGLFLNVSIDIEDPQGGPLFDITCSFGLWSAHLTVQHLCQDGCISQPCLTYRWYLCFILLDSGMR